MKNNDILDLTNDAVMAEIQKSFNLNHPPLETKGVALMYWGLLEGDRHIVWRDCGDGDVMTCFTFNDAQGDPFVIHGTPRTLIHDLFTAVLIAREGEPDDDLDAGQRAEVRSGNAEESESEGTAQPQ